MKRRWPSTTISANNCSTGEKNGNTQEGWPMISRTRTRKTTYRCGDAIISGVLFRGVLLPQVGSDRVHALCILTLFWRVELSE